MELSSHNVHLARQNAPGVYVRHRPETTLLYQIVQDDWPEFQAELSSQDRYLPAYVTKEFDEYLKCGRLEHGFLRVRCESCHDEKLVAFSCKRRGSKYRDGRSVPVAAASRFCLGVLAGSLLSAAAGLLVLYFTLPNRK